jgi:hypothetical protein
MKAALNGGGDRSAKFEVRMTLPAVAAGDAAATEKLTFTCSAASIPPMIIGNIPVPYFGRTINVAGDRQYPEWVITVINDEDYLVRRVMEQWSHRINTARTNVTTAPFTASPNSYKTDGWIYKYGKEGGAPLRVYKFVGLWPSMVEPIELNWADRDRIAEFRVVFQYDYWSNDVDILEGDGSSQILV